MTGDHIPHIIFSMPPPTYSFRNPFTETLGLRLMAARLWRHMTRGELASKCQAQAQQILYYEQDRQIPRIPLFLELARALDVPGSLLLGEGPRPRDFGFEMALRYAWQSGPLRQCPLVMGHQFFLDDINAVSWGPEVFGFPHDELHPAT